MKTNCKGIKGAFGNEVDLFFNMVDIVQSIINEITERS
jgi:hypothetical protein